MIISKVQASCGCTTPEWSQDPIMPGKTAQIKVGYNTTIVGPFTKIIEVYSNDPANSRSVINIKGTVEGGGEISTRAEAAKEMKATVTPALNSAKAVPAKAKKVVKKPAAI